MDLRPPPKRSQHDVHDLDALFAWLEDHYRIFDQYASSSDPVSTTSFARANVNYVDADDITINPGACLLDGSTKSLLYWDSALSFKFGSGGSNGSSDDLVATDWFYLYVDDSAVAAAQTNILTASEFIGKKADPTWSNDKMGWYDSNDRCLFAVRTDGGGDILKFHNWGTDDVLYDVAIEDLASTDINTTWVEVELTVPLISSGTYISARTSSVGAAAANAYWRSGQSSGGGHLWGRSAAGCYYSIQFFCSSCRNTSHRWNWD